MLGVQQYTGIILLLFTVIKCYLAYCAALVNIPKQIAALLSDWTNFEIVQDAFENMDVCETCQADGGSSSSPGGAIILVNDLTTAESTATTASIQPPTAPTVQQPTIPSPLPTNTQSPTSTKQPTDMPLVDPSTALPSTSPTDATPAPSDDPSSNPSLAALTNDTNNYFMTVFIIILLSFVIFSTNGTHYGDFVCGDHKSLTFDFGDAKRLECFATGIVFITAINIVVSTDFYAWSAAPSPLVSAAPTSITQRKRSPSGDLILAKKTFIVNQNLLLEVKMKQKQKNNSKR